MRNFLASVAVVFTLSGQAYAQDFQRGLAAYEAGDYATAFQEWKPLAEQGDASAQYKLGYMYDAGEGVPQDYKEAASWWRKAAEQGYADAQYNLADMYAEGDGVPQDDKESARWLRKAAEQGDHAAQFGLGKLYSLGWGVLQDYVMAHMWYNIASANGHERGGQSRDVIASVMSQEAIEKAQALAR